MKKSLYIIMISIIALVAVLFAQYEKILKETNNVSQKAQSTEVKEKKRSVNYNIEIVDLNYKSSLYEPKDACYLGAYILSNHLIDFDIEKFEEKTNCNHGVYLYNMKLGDIVPESWLLSCISLGKTPCLIINAPNEYYPYQEQLLEDTVKSISNFYVPMFIQFYPNPTLYNSDPKQYINFYQTSYRYFKQYAPNTAIIWSVSSEKLYESSLFYPGDNFVDWIGLNLLTNANDEKLITKIDNFYEMYEYKKPLMLSQFAVSHYNESNHKYYIKKTQDILKKIYSSLESKYNRIKCINYLDINNYSITENTEILKQYSESTNNKHFKDKINDTMAALEYKETYKYKTKAICIDEHIYIDDRLLKILKIDEFSIPKDYILYYDNNYYYPIEYINDELDYNISVSNKTIRIEKKFK